MDGHLITPSKVTAWLACPHYLTLESQVAAGTRKRPRSITGSYAQLLRDKGNAHEKACLADFKTKLRVAEIPEKAEGESFVAFVERVSRNRLNVAVSRARCLAYLVCTEDLLNTRARSVDDMRLISTLNAFAEYAEKAETGPSTFRSFSYAGWATRHGRSRESERDHLRRPACGRSDD